MAVDMNDQWESGARGSQLTYRTGTCFVVRKVLTRLDRDTLHAARAVADAIHAVDQAKFAGGREVHVRNVLFRACRTLRTQLKNLEAKHGQ